MMEIKSTLKVYNESELTSFPGVVQGQMQKQLVGDAAHPSERITVRTASFPAGIHERLHWHLIEAFYYVISGKAVIDDAYLRFVPNGRLEPVFDFWIDFITDIIIRINRNQS